MYAGMIGGHCVLPNLDLLGDDTLLLIKEINKEFTQEMMDIEKKTTPSKTRLLHT